MNTTHTPDTLTQASLAKLASFQGRTCPSLCQPTHRRYPDNRGPLGVLGLQAIRWLLEHGALVIAAGGGGTPVVRAGDGSDPQGLHGVAAVFGSLDPIENMLAVPGSTQLCLATAGRTGTV
jgi:carbamate kinase